MNKLQQLIEQLNFQAKNQNDVSTIFDSIAEEIFNNYQIEANDVYYRLLEIEFYFYSDYHKDESSHKNEKQKSSLEWYFHYSGIDITIGNEQNFGGILIRSIGEIGNRKNDTANLEKVINGPLKTKDELLNNFKPVVNCECNVFSLNHVENHQDAFHYQASCEKFARFGINACDYVNEKYRYVIYKEHFEKQYKKRTLIV